MRLALNDEQRLLGEATRAFLAMASPIGAARSLMVDHVGIDPTVWRQGVEQGWTGVVVPAALGGLGGSAVDLMVVAEELGRVAYTGPFLSTNLVIDALVRWGSQHQKDDVMTKLMRGELTGSWCAVEDSCRWDSDGIESQATPRGDGFEITGFKSFVPSGHLADVLLVLARVEGELTHLLVPSDTEGIEKTPVGAIDFTRRFSHIRFNGVQVPRSAVLGEVGSGGVALTHLLNVAAVLVSADSVGGADVMLNRTVEYCLERVAFGVPIGSYQAIKHKCANMLIWLESARAATLAAALAIANDATDVDQAVSIAKSYSSEMLSQFMLESLQIHGGIGYTWEHDLHLYFRRIKTTESLFGDVAWHRERIAISLEGSPG